MNVHPSVTRFVDRYIAEVDAAVPNFIDGAYLTGSAALGDYRPDISDIDLVAVCRHRPHGPELDALETLHRSSRPNIDVLYVTAADLRADPRLLSAPHSLDGTFHRDGAFAANPVEWRTLQTRALTVRGPELQEDDVWFEARALRQWNLDNLDDYWVGRLDWWRGLEPTEELVRHQYGLQWLVLGVPRLHHTIATLEVTSKTGAGQYVHGLVDERWRPVIETCIALRSNRAAPLSLSLEELRGDAVHLVDWVIEDAHRLVVT